MTGTLIGFFVVFLLGGLAVLIWSLQVSGEHVEAEVKTSQMEQVRQIGVKLLVPLSFAVVVLIYFAV